MKGNLFLEKKKRNVWIAISLIIVLLAAGGVAFVLLRKNNDSDFPARTDGMGMNGGFSLSENMVTASGVINVGVTEESFEVENLTTELVVEEVYISSEAEIDEGAKVLKLTEDSVEEARDELEKTLREAELAYRTGAIEYEQNKITAEYDYRSALLAGEQASEIYQETVSGLQRSIETAEEELADAKEKIAEYQSYVNDGSYKSYFKVDEYEALYEENLKVLTDKMDEWGVSWEQVTGSERTGDQYSCASILANLYKVLEQNGKDLEQAESDYEDAVRNAAFELQTLELNLPSLEQAVTEAKKSYEVQAGEATLTYEKALANAERAENDYETALEKAESDYETLERDYAEAKENLELFEKSVGDGYFYASGSGTVLRTMARAEQVLTSGSILFMYSNPDYPNLNII